MRKDEQLDYEQMKQKALEQLRSGKSLYGKDGAFAPLLKSFLDSALEAELESHLDSDERLSGNRKNGKTSKEVRTSSGTITIDTPRDRSSTFEPELIRKRETILAESLESKIIGMYGLGMSLREISKHIKDLYDIEISHTTLSAITDKIIPRSKGMAVPSFRRSLHDCMAGCYALQSKRGSPHDLTCSLQYYRHRSPWV